MRRGATAWRLGLLGLLALCGSAWGQSCRVTSSGLNFGDVSNVETLSISAVGELELRCSAQGNAGQSLRVCISPGDGAVGNREIEARRGSVLALQVYSDPARNRAWGDDADALVVDIGSLAQGQNVVTIPVYGQIFGGQIPGEDGNYDLRLEPVVTAELNSSAPCSAITGNARRGRFEVSATVGAFCNITASDLLFPPAASFASPLQATSELRFVCPAGVDYAISLDGGAVTGDISDRRMAHQGGGADTVQYQLYLDPARSRVWGDGAQGETLDGIGVGATDLRSVYGEIPVQPSVAGGTYQDQVTARIVF